MFVPCGTSKTSGIAAQAAPRRTMIVFLTTLAILVAMFVFAASPAPVAAASDGYIDTDVLNLRESPGTDGSIIAVMWEGEPVTVYEGTYYDGWYLIDYQGQVGWANGGYLSINGIRGWASEQVVAGPAAERWIDFDRSSQTVTLYEGDFAVASYWGAIGWDTSADGFFATALGTYYVYSKYEPVSWSDWGQTYIRYWVGYDPARSNGFHSYSVDANGDVVPGGDGETGGCIALDLGAAAAVFDFATIGMRVEIHW